MITYPLAVALRDEKELTLLRDALIVARDGLVREWNTWMSYDKGRAAQIKDEIQRVEAEPTDADIESALAEHNDIFGRICVVCSGPVKALSARISHRAYGNVKKWQIDSVVYEDFIELSFRPSSGETAFMSRLGKAHPGCFWRLFPYAKVSS